MNNEIRNMINKVKNFGLSENVNAIVENNGFEIVDIYDAENIKGLICAMKLNNVVPNYLYEAVDFELDNPGGVIIFSTDLNSTLESVQTLVGKVRFFFDSKWKTYLNRLNVGGRLKKILLDKYELPGYTVGRNFKGSYTGKNGKTFDEKSFTIDIAGVDSDALKLMATEICREFKQETVMVRDFNEGATKVYFVNDKTI